MKDDENEDNKEGLLPKTWNIGPVLGFIITIYTPPLKDTENQGKNFVDLNYLNTNNKWDADTNNSTKYELQEEAMNAAMSRWVVIPVLIMKQGHSKPDEDAVDLYSKTQGPTDGRRPSSQDPSAAERWGLQIGWYQYWMLWLC